MFPLTGMRAFSLIWFGQLVSIIGTAMTRFALMVWAYEESGAATSIALLGFFSFVPILVISPFAGVVIDRYDRRKIMIIADVGSACATLTVLLLYVSGQLQIWHLVVLLFVSSIFGVLQGPAYNAAMSMLIPKRYFDRANGMRTLALYSGEIFAPFLAGALLVIIGTGGVLLIDLLSFLAAMITLALCRIPHPPPSEFTRAAVGKFWQEISLGYRFIYQRKGLLGLVIIYMGRNFFAGLASILPAMILARTGGNEIILANVQAVLGIGGFVGGLFVSFVGIPLPRTRMILICGALSFILGDLLFAMGREPLVWMLAGFLSALFVPPMLSAMNVIWQVKVPPDLQGKVFAAQYTFRNLSTPFGFLLSGPLADIVFEPAMAEGGGLVPLFGHLVGTGEGAGMAVMFLFTGVLGVSVVLSGFLYAPIRHLERDLPDYDSGAASLEPEPIAA